ncbi:MAG TPA: hypothetical protein VEH08_04280 [Methanomassiliicoccales archaeon]|nr:hypothetical protein [Methanomassiliicoccales archaeon]
MDRTVTSDTNLFSSGVIPPGGKFVHQFIAIGVHLSLLDPYLHDRDHHRDRMTGFLVLERALSPPSSR